MSSSNTFTEWIPDVMDIRDNFFSSDKWFPAGKTLISLDDIIPWDGERKIEFDLKSKQDVPIILSQAVEFACDETKTKYTTAILKDYWPEKDSWVYSRHKDPSRFVSGPLFLLTLRWCADFSVWDREWRIHTHEAIHNRLILANPYLEHQVSPPKGWWYRSFLFLWVDK